MASTPDDAEAAAAAIATPLRNETEDRDSTHVRAATRGDETPSSTKPPRRDGSPSSMSTNSGGFITPSADASGGRSSEARSTPQLPSMRRVSSDYEGSEVSSRRDSLTRSSRRLFRDNSIGQRSSSTRSVLSFGSSGSAINPKASVSAAVKAAGDGDARSVMQFLNSGGDINAKCKTGASTPLSRAAAKGHLKIVKLLLDREAGVNVPGRGGLTPLHEAAGCGKVEVCRLLLGSGAAVAARDHSKRTPLHYAGTSVEVTKLLLEFGADPNAQDKNGQRPDAMAISHEARALLRDARCTVREDAVGDNASRVIASLRRELENLELEAHAAKESASEEEARRKEIQLEVDQLRGHVSKLSEENEILKQEAAATGPIDQVPEATQAELKQMRASLRVARAAASEEKRRRENLEDSFDSHVAEAVAKAIAVAASRLLDRMPDSEEEEDEDEGADKRAKRGEGVDGDGEEQASKSAGGNAWVAEVGKIEPDHGDGDADLPEPVRAVPSAWGGKREDGGRFSDADGDADGGDADGGDAGGGDADGGDADGGDDGSDAEDKEEEQGGKGFVEQRIDELLEATAKALLPRPTTLRQRHSVGAIPPRQAAGSPTWVSTKGYGSEGSKSDMGCSGGSGGDAEEEGGRLLTVKARSLENFFRGESAERIESGQPFETVGADWTGTNEDNQDERGTASGAAAPPSTTSEDLAQDVGIGEYRPATRDKEDEDGSIHDEAIVDPSTISPDDVAATGAVAKDSLGESSASPEGGVGVNVEPDAAGGDASPGDILEKEVLIHPFLQSTISHRLPSSSSNLQTPSLESVLRAESTERIGSGQPSPVTRGSLARDPLGGDSTGTNEDTQDERGTVPGVAAPPSTTSDDLAQDVSIGECRPAPRDKEDGDDSIHDETVVDPSTISPDDVAATGAVAKDSLGESSASPDGGVGVNVEPDAAGGDASPGDILEEEVLIHPFLQSTIAHRLPSSASLQPPSLESVLQAESTERIGSGQPSPATGGSSAQAPLDTVEAGWAGKDKENQNKRGTAPGDAAAPSTTWEDRVQGVDIGKCIPALGDEGDGDDSIHVKAVAEPSTLEPEDTAATLAAAEGTPRESSVSPGHGIGVSAEPVAARGDESSSDSAETAEGQGEGAAAGGLGGDAVPSVLEDLADEMVAALDVDDEEDDYFRYEGDDDDYYDDDDDDDDIDFFNYLSKYETESSKDVGQTTDARVWEGLAAALKVELEEKKVRIFDLSTENRRLRREAADWAKQCAYQKKQNHHEQLERQRQQQQQEQQQRWWQQWWGQLWWVQEQQDRDVETSLHERVGMCETEPEPEGGILGRMFHGIPRVAHAYWEH